MESVTQQYLWSEMKQVIFSHLKCFTAVIATVAVWHCDCLLLTDDSQAGNAPSGSPLPCHHHLPPPAEGAAEAPCPSFPAVAVRTPPAGPGEDRLPNTPSPASNRSGESEEEQQEQKEQKLLYCSLCKVAVNSLSQLEAHNKGQSQSHTGHTTSPATHSHTPLQLPYLIAPPTGRPGNHDDQVYQNKWLIPN